MQPGNILIENIDIGQVKVCDFGLSMVVAKQGALREGTTDNVRCYGTPAYAAPGQGMCYFPLPFLLKCNYRITNGAARRKSGCLFIRYYVRAIFIYSSRARYLVFRGLCSLLINNTQQFLW